MYEALLEEARAITDKAMRAAWAQPVDANDIDQNLDPRLLDPAALTSSENAFREAVAVHLRKLAPRWS